MATTTTTTTTATSGVPMRNPKDSMKATWYDDNKQWGFYHYALKILGLAVHNKNPPVYQKTDKIPHLGQWPQHRWVLVHAYWPVALHQLYFWYFQQNLHPVAVFALYTAGFQLNGMALINLINGLGKKHGYLDGDKHDRDGVPDHSVGKVVNSLLYTLTLRPLLAMLLTWDSNAPVAVSWWIPLELGFYSVILDFWFYWYHRMMHANEGLWKYHRTHHLTKHPNPLLTLYADGEQEIFDILGVPLMTWLTMRLMGLPMGFYDWWICFQYVAFSELMGHGGVRVYNTTPSTFQPILKFFDAELTVEDHDLHHRKGWKKSHNYGKQTRLWDRAFGTCYERYETLKENIDFANPISMPVFTLFSRG